nr:MAG TPA: hypothetical protein [Caudoviricetes sp.]
MIKPQSRTGSGKLKPAGRREPKRLAEIKKERERK